MLAIIVICGICCRIGACMCLVSQLVQKFIALMLIIKLHHVSMTFLFCMCASYLTTSVAAAKMEDSNALALCEASEGATSGFALLYSAVLDCS